jgi:hypothetical protein
VTPDDPLPSWNNGSAKNSVVDFVEAATDEASPGFLPEEERIATFDQDGTLWVEHPLVTQIMFAFDRVTELASSNPKWKETEPFKSILAHDQAGMAKFTMQDLELVAAATHAGMTTGDFQAIASGWLAKARDPHWKRPYTELIYQPMLEVGCGTIIMAL